MAAPRFAFLTMSLMILAAVLLPSAAVEDSRSLLPPIMASETTPSGRRSQDIQTAILEMRKANYFTFVMLINMAPPDLFQGNITFFMPTDRILSRNAISNVSDFLLRHAVPSPMLFSPLSFIPTDSVIPSMRPDYNIRITNMYGGLSYFLNNVRLTLPDLCVAGPSVRCHGIEDVLLATASGGTLTSCPTLTPPNLDTPPGDQATPAVGHEPAPAPPAPANRNV